MLVQASSKCHRHIGSEFEDKYLFAPAALRRILPISSSSCRVVVEGGTSRTCLKLEFVQSPYGIPLQHSMHT